MSRTLPNRAAVRQKVPDLLPLGKGGLRHNSDAEPALGRCPGDGTEEHAHTGQGLLGRAATRTRPPEYYHHAPLCVTQEGQNRTQS